MQKRGILALIGLALVACQGQATDPVDGSNYWGGPEAAAVDQRLVTAQNTFGFKLFGELAAADPGGNVFISPTSVAMALSMAYNGASGETQIQMAQALQMQGMSLDELNEASAALLAVLADPEPKVRLRIANSLWARIGVPFESSFMERNAEYYAAEITALDFGDPEAATRINDWVSEKTEGTIETIINPPLPDTAILYLINAVYFKGTWTWEFDPEKTTDDPFHLSDGQSVSVPMMKQTVACLYLDGDGFSAIRLPYGSERLGMYIFLPDGDMPMADFQERLSPENWDRWLSEFDTTEIEVALPRFEIAYKAKLNAALQHLGMVDAFTDSADFSAMTSKPVLISEVRHKTFLKVNEEGTEASAVTLVEMIVTSDPGRTIFHVNRPFFCAIHDSGTGVILFMGTIADPRE